MRLAVSHQENETAVMNIDPQAKKTNANTNTESRKLHWWVYFNQCAAHLWLGIRALWPLWFGSFALVAIWIIIVIFGCREKGIRLLGMFLQLVGFLTVAKGLRDSSRLFKKPTILERIALYFNGFPRRRVMINSMSGQFSGPAATASVRASVSPGSDTPLERRVEMLEEKTEHLFSQVGELGKRLRAQSEDLTRKITEEGTQRKEGHGAFEKMLERAVIGGIHVEWWGVFLFIAGIILASASPELAGLLGNSGNCG